MVSISTLQREICYRTSTSIERKTIGAYKNESQTVYRNTANVTGLFQGDKHNKTKLNDKGDKSTTKLINMLCNL